MKVGSFCLFVVSWYACYYLQDTTHTACDSLLSLVKFWKKLPLMITHAPWLPITWYKWELINIGDFWLQWLMFAQLSTQFSSLFHSWLTRFTSHTQNSEWGCHKRLQMSHDCYSLGTNESFQVFDSHSPWFILSCACKFSLTTLLLATFCYSVETLPNNMPQLIVHASYLKYKRQLGLFASSWSLFMLATTCKTLPTQHVTVSYDS